MNTLTLNQLKQIPWNRIYESGPEVPPEPPIEEINKLVKVPFNKRDREYALFYSWSEILKYIGNQACRVLDTSCGRGQVSQALYMKGFDVSACDVEDYFCADREHINFQIVDLNEKMNYSDNHFDKIINCEGIEYLLNSEMFIKESRRILADSGEIILSVPNIHSFSSIYSFFRWGTLLSYSADMLTRKNIIYLPHLINLMKVHNFELVFTSGNVPLINAKIKLFTKLLSRFSAFHSNDYLKFAHSLILVFKLNKKS